MQYIIKLRILDIEIRREKIANLRKLIQETTEQVAKIKEVIHLIIASLGERI